MPKNLGTEMPINAFVYLSLFIIFGQDVSITPSHCHFLKNIKANTEYSGSVRIPVLATASSALPFANGLFFTGSADFDFYQIRGCEDLVDHLLEN